MKITFFILLIFWLVSDICLASDIVSGRVIKVLDGDSMVVRTPHSMMEVRLYGIDSPEYGQPYSAAAKKFVKNLTGGHSVTLKPLYKDSYGRTVAVVQVGTSIVNEKLVVNGLAWVYDRYCRKKICESWRKSQERAKDERRGLWAAPNPLPPWVYKRAVK